MKFKHLKSKVVAFSGASIIALASCNASAGNIILTGHDTDDHQASDFMNWALTALVNNGNGTPRPLVPDTTTKIGYIGNFSANLSTYLGSYDNFGFYDLDVASWTNAFSDNNDILVIGSGFDFISIAGAATMATQQASFTTYFNGGGNLFVNTHQGLGSSFYDFLPNIGNVNASNLTSCASESGDGLCMSPTAAGTASGLLLTDIVQASITHNQFSADPVFTDLEEYVPTGNAITIGLFGGTIGGGGFQGGGSSIPEPATLALLGLGLAGIGACRRKKIL